MGDYTCDTVIIGGGLAGIAAARTLERHNNLSKNAPVNYVVLEADDKIGGRVQSETIKTLDGKNVIINPGAQWFHRDVREGTPENPLLDHVDSSDLLIRDTMPREFWEKGKRKKYVDRINDVNAGRRAIDKHHGPDTDLKTLFIDQGLGTSSALITTFGPVETGAPLEEVSAEDVRELVACNRGDFSRAGLSRFVERYAKDVRKNVQLETPVTRIRWRPGDVEIRTKNGDVYHAKHCIITVSVGVLKSDQIQFEPALPEACREQLAHIFMGNFNKIFLMFDSKFKFPVNHNTHLDVRTKKGDDIFYLARDNGQPLVTTFFGGELAKLCDSDPEAAKKLAIDGLCEIWGEEVRGHIIDTRVTQWGNNPLVQGGYSRVDIGHHSVREKLAEPINDTLYLAGEAIGAKHPQSGRNWATHMAGAAISGERAAGLILQAIKKESPAAHADRAPGKTGGATAYLG